MSQDNLIINSLAEQFGTRKSSLVADKKLADAVRSSLFPKQLQVLEDGYDRKAVLCPRRSGKSWTALAYAFDTALRKPSSVSLIVCLTLKSCKEIYWNSLVNKFLTSYGIKAKLHHTDLRITLANGSYIRFTGAETKAEIEKIRGGSYDLVVVDECRSYAPIVISEMVLDAIGPALDDRAGTLMLIGTPGRKMTDHLFFQATCPGASYLDFKGQSRLYSRTFDSPEEYWKGRKGPQWSRHTWTRKENTKTASDLWAAALRTKELNGWADDHPTWLAEYLAQWVDADDSFVYAYAGLARENPDLVHWSPSKRTETNTAGLPDGGSTNWRFILGCDLGYEDDFAVVVCAYNPTDGALYQVWDYKDNHQDAYEIADTLDGVIKTFGQPDAMVGDAAGLGKLVIETLNKRHGLYLQPADKREKFDHIELLNADLKTGRIKLIKGSDLALEMSNLQFDLSKHGKKELARLGKLREDPKFPNHLCDAFLYAWRFSHHYWSKPKTSQYSREEAIQQAEQRWIEDLLAKRDNPLSLGDQLRGSSVDVLEPFYGQRYDSFRRY